MKVRMYPIDEVDRLLELPEVPRPEPGAPCPVLLAEENRLVLSYWLPETPPYPADPTAPFAFIRFERPYFHSFGPPNDEALQGHPLSARGLEPCRVYQVAHSSLIRRLESMNAVHPCHSAALFADFRHYLFTFHDSTFECVAVGFQAYREYIHVDEQLARIAALLAAS